MNTNLKTILVGVGASVVASLCSVSIYSQWNKSRFNTPCSKGDLFVQCGGRDSVVVVNAPDFTIPAEKAVHAVVHIRSSVTLVSRGRSSSGDPFFDFFFGDRGFQPQEPQKQEGIGSGVIISQDGYIVTNNHVIEKADEIEVTLNDKRSFKAKLVGTDPTTDIALLKVEAQNLPTIPLGNSDNLKVGEWVLAIGNPYNLSSTVTAGIVSSKSRSIGIINNGKNTMGIESFIQTDAAVNPGNSGGALVNTRGELVGINTAIASKTGAYSGYSFAVPVSIMSKVVTDLKQYGEVQRALLGISIQEIDANLAKNKNIGLEGVYVAAVGERSAAMQAGIKEGDVITEINGVKVQSVSSLQEQVNRYRPGDKIEVKVLRNQKIMSFSVLLKNSMGGTEVVKATNADILGVSMRTLPKEDKQRLGLRYGVEVTDLKEGKLGKAGVRQGYIILKVNNTPVNSPEEITSMVESILRSAENEKALFITGIYPNGKMAYYVVDLVQ